MPESISIKQARRLALVAAGLYRPRWNGLPSRARGRGSRARKAALDVIRHFGYLQLDTISITGCRSHGLVLLSRLRGLDPSLAEDLLKPGQPLFEYWGHEACWLPMELYPLFEFRRRRFRRHPWWGDLLNEHADLAGRIRRRIEDEGPLRSLDLEGTRAAGMWNLKLARRVADALWSCGELAIRQRRSFQIYYDLPSRVVPESILRQRVGRDESVRRLLLLALRGHGWATTGTLASTWRLRNMAPEIKSALARLEEEGEVVGCALAAPDRAVRGWIRPADLERADRLGRMPPPADRAVLLSPFDPLLWDRARVEQLFGFHQVLEIFKPAEDRIYGYYCLPVLVGEALVARCDLKAHRRLGRLDVVSTHFESRCTARQGALMKSALDVYADALGLRLSE